MSIKRIVTILLLMAGLPLTAAEPQTAVLPGNFMIVMPAKASPTLAYAADRTATELRVVHKLKAEVRAGDRFKKPSGQSGMVIFAVADSSAEVERLSRELKLDLPGFNAPAENASRVIVRTNPTRVVIIGRTDVAAWYGACAWLDSLLSAADGAVSMPLRDFDDAPALAIRFTRGLMPGAQPPRMAEAIAQLDWWARWRMNVTHSGGGSDAFLREYLPEAHKRGIRVVRGLGVRSLCASDDEAVARCAKEFEDFLQAGGDGVSALWDDLAHERCAGHCDRCRARFGTNSLPHEIVRVLEALCDVAARSPRKPLILWCPSHYSENRYKEMPDADFFRVIGASKKIREMTQMYHCEFAPEKVAVLDRFGITNRIWWYNGMRTVYHVSHHWPTQPDMKLSIPDVKTFGASDFARFEVGWKTGIGVRSNGTVVPAPEKTWLGFRTVPQRFQGYYPCVDTHPYHAAVSGLFAYDPAQFDQAEADRVTFRALFGEGGVEPARQWSDAFVQFQVWLAQTSNEPSSESLIAEARQRLKDWRSHTREVKAVVAKKRFLLSPKILESALLRMEEAEESVENILNQRDASGQ